MFSPMVVDAVTNLDNELLDLSLVGIKKVPGGSVTDSFLVHGVAFKKTFSCVHACPLLRLPAATTAPPHSPPLTPPSPPAPPATPGSSK